MASFMPFEPLVKNSSAGLTVVVTPGPIGGGVASTVDSTGGQAASLLVTTTGTTPAWVRISTETATVAAGQVSTTDVAIPANTVRIFANPNPVGKTAVAVVCTVTTTLSNVYFTPGNGGDD